MSKHQWTARRLLVTAGGAAALSASPMLAAQPDNCRFEAERTATVDAAGAELLEVVARAGSLVVAGVPGSMEVRVRGRACAATEELLEEARLSAERRGASVHVEALLPEQISFPDRYARLDLFVEAPAWIAADIDDSSGAMELARLGALTIVDSSGEIEIEDVSGSVRITDSSGEIEVARVRGDVEIDDSSGEIELRDVEGSVLVSDSSGGIDASGIGGGVTVRRDSSGAIRVADVGGDLVVLRDTSGGVSYRNVAGSVRVPDDG